MHLSPEAHNNQVSYSSEPIKATLLTHTPLTRRGIPYLQKKSKYHHKSCKDLHGFCIFHYRRGEWLGELVNPPLSSN